MTCLGMGLLGLGYAVYASFSAILGIFGKGFGASPKRGTAAIFADDVTRALAAWSIMRLLPFAAATAVLIVLALRIRQGDVSAIRAARTWTLWALGAVAIYLVLTVVGIVPLLTSIDLPTLGHRQRAGQRSALGQSVDLVTIALWGTAIGTTIAASVWPVILRVWTGRLLASSVSGDGPQT